MLLLPANVTLRESRDTLRLLSQSLRNESSGEGVVIDASTLHHFDTSALAVLLECQRMAQAWGKTFLVRSAPAKLVALAKLYGVDVLLFSASSSSVGADATPTTPQ